MHRYAGNGLLMVLVHIGIELKFFLTAKTVEEIPTADFILIFFIKHRGFTYKQIN